MRKNGPILLAMLVLATLLVVGCGDDDECPTCPTPTVVPPTYTNGVVSLNSATGLYLFARTNALSGANPDVDSIMVDTVAVPVYSSHNTGFADPLWHSEYYEQEDPSAYDSGDTITISLYGSGLSSECDIKLLHRTDDAANVISPSYETTVNTGDTVEVIWNKVDNAEYYAIYTQLGYDSSGTMVYENNYTFSDDTTYICPERFTDTTVSQFYFFIMPTCGPDPRSPTGNWTGDLTTGVLYSYGAIDNTLVLVTEPPPGMAKATSKENDIAPEVTAWEIIQGVYGLNR